MRGERGYLELILVLMKRWPIGLCKCYKWVSAGAVAILALDLSLVFVLG